jgi:acyl-homoserine lactone acylase PvdQ
MDAEALAEAVALLGAWDRRVSVDSVAMTVAHFFVSRYLEEASLPQGLNFMERVEYLGTETEPAERIRVLAGTLAALEDDFGDWRQAWGEVNRFQRLSGAIDAPFSDQAPSEPVGLASGRWGALAAYGARRFGDSRRLYGYRGNSFVAVVEFGERVRAKSLLAGGQSNDPSSPHFLDQLPLYTAGTFKEVAYYREDVLARAQCRYRPGQPCLAE